MSPDKLSGILKIPMEPRNNRLMLSVLVMLATAAVFFYMDARPVNPPSAVTPSEETQPINSPIEVDLTGKPVKWLTYGRIVVKSHTPNTSFSYFIVEPDDVVEDGALRYSSSTRYLTGEELLRIKGRMLEGCFWNEAEYSGCVPFIVASIVEEIS